jgi:hypothetical protein
MLATSIGPACSFLLSAVNSSSGDVERLRHHQRQVGREHDQIAMRDVDEPHHAEDQRQAGGEHGVESADQHALENDVDPIHAAQTPK